MGSRSESSECLPKEDLLGYADGNASIAAQEAIERHLNGCPLCSRIVQALVVTTLPPAPGNAERVPPETRVGRYVVKRYLGAGAMGTVYEAADPDLDRKVAIKLLRERPGDATGLSARLLHEAKAMAKVSHPEVVAIYDVGSFGDQVFLAMELVPGRTVRAWLGEAPRSWRDCVQIFERAGRGLAALHAAGLVHRDFKPENVLVGEGGRVCVSDFGLARVVDDVAAASVRAESVARGAAARAWRTRTGALLGTPAYMAPEQWRGEVAGPPADQFSFCVALYEALFDQRPFAGDSIEELYPNVVAGEVRKPPPDGRVPAWLRAVVLRGLRPGVRNRHPSMAALLQALGRPRPPLATVAMVSVSVAVVAGAALLAGMRAAPPDVKLALGAGPDVTADVVPAVSGVPAVAIVAPSASAVPLPSTAPSSTTPSASHPPAPRASATPPARPASVYVAGLQCPEVCAAALGFQQDVETQLGAIARCWSTAGVDPAEYKAEGWALLVNADGSVVEVVSAGTWMWNGSVRPRSPGLDACVGGALRRVRFRDVVAAGEVQLRLGLGI